MKKILLQFDNLQASFLSKPQMKMIFAKSIGF
jgi:hypothetical protein